MAKITFGQIALALLTICLASGVLVAIPYDVEKAYLSISTMMVLNPAASFLRNIHFWSAQFFLVAIFLHIWDHFNRKNEITLKKGVWLRLTIGVLIILLVMLTGFLLKGDADSKQAWRILDSLLLDIPIFGNVLSKSILGNEGSLQLVYVHHIATFTIFIVIITFEHSRKIWAQYAGFVISILFIGFLSFFFTATLHDGTISIVKGPWYFVGFQEILHWLSMPSFSLIIIIVVLALIFLIPYVNSKLRFYFKRILLIFMLFYLLLTIIGVFFRGESWKWAWPMEANYSTNVLSSFNVMPINLTGDIYDNDLQQSNEILGGTESCIICHDDVIGFTSSHNPQAIGCYSCHGGNPFDGNKNGAHEGMLLIPGNYTDADRSCGTASCHPDITSRKNTNLMYNVSGMISVDRFVFNEQDNPDLLTDIHKIGDSPADEHLKNMCVICHLGNPKIIVGPPDAMSRGGGCLACHLNYDKSSTQAWQSHVDSKNDSSYLHFHPAISMKVTNNHCFGCHSRSGRISTNYEGWAETIIEVENMPVSDSFRLIEDTRVFRYISEDVHFGLGLECIDCHNSKELMGDGNFYAHEEEQNSIACSDCHFNNKPVTVSGNSMDNESAIIASMRFGNISDKEFLVTKKRNIPLINTSYSNDTAYLFSKNNDNLFVLSGLGATCTKGVAHDDVSCSACHSAWAPSCIGCHNQYDNSELGYNMLTNREQNGSWVEFVGDYNVNLPALGIRESDSINEIIPVVPGMVLTIDVGAFSKSNHDSLIFRRLFAPAAPHTTSAKGRSCKSCHNNPVALGYGKGDLVFDINNKKWTFKPLYNNNLNDNLPEDSWVGFLDDRKGEVVSTRSNVKPFSVDDQKRMLTVGACLVCHDERSMVMQQSLFNFDSLVAVKSEKCVTPNW